MNESVEIANLKLLNQTIETKTKVQCSMFDQIDKFQHTLFERERERCLSVSFILMQATKFYTRVQQN